MKTALDMLKAGFATLSDKSKWTTFAYARDAVGRIVLPADVSAHCWCSSGLLLNLRAGPGEKEYQKAYGFLSDAARAIPTISSDIISVNDFAGYDCTMLMWQKAIELAQAKEM